MKTNLKELRLKNNITQAQLEQKTGIAQALLSKYESGKKLPTTGNLIKLADFYKVSLDTLLGRNGYDQN